MLLGFIGYYRSFIPAYAKKTSNMNSQKMYKKLELTAEMESELENLKDEFERAHPGSAAVRQWIDLSVDHQLQSESDVSFP